MKKWTHILLASGAVALFLGMSATATEQTQNVSHLKVTDASGKNITAGETLDFFEQGDKYKKGADGLDLIAPGSSGSYSFDMTNSENFRGRVTFTEENKKNIPIVYTITATVDGKENKILTDEKLTTETYTSEEIAAGKTIHVNIAWKWEHATTDEDKEFENELGRGAVLGVHDYKLTLAFHSEEYPAVTPPADEEPSGILPRTIEAMNTAWDELSGMIPVTGEAQSMLGIFGGILVGLVTLLFMARQKPLRRYVVHHLRIMDIDTKLEEDERDE
jgi:hypothetical protein